MTTLDELRAKYAHLSFTLYAYVGQPVTLEVITQDGKVFPFTGATSAAAIAAAFPEDSEPEPPQAPPSAPAASVFD